MATNGQNRAMVSLLRDRSFRLLAVGQFASRLGDGLFTAAIAWLAWRLGHDPGAVAAVVVAANLPTFLASVVGASYADRYDRRRLMIVTDLVRAGLVGAAAVVVALGVVGIGGLVALVAIVGLAGAPFAPARNALVPRLVPPGRLLEANGLLQVSFRAAFFVGPLLLAPVLAAGPLPAALLLDAATFLFSAATLLGVRRGVPSPEDRRDGLWVDLAGGFAALRRRPEVMVVIATFVCALMAASGFLSVGLIALVGRRLGGGAGEYGLLLGISGLCEILGALVIARLHLRALALTAVLAWVLVGAFRFPLGLVTAPLEAGALLVATGFASALTDIPLIALVQVRIPDRHLAKALGLWEGGIAGATAFAPLIAAAVIARLGVPAGFMLSGGALVVLGLTAAGVLRRVGVGEPSTAAPGLPGTSNVAPSEPGPARNDQRPATSPVASGPKARAGSLLGTCARTGGRP